MKSCAVIILNWNGRRLLEQFLPSAAANTISARADLIVADNGSTDDSVSWIRSRLPGVKVLELGENYGFAGGYNRAVALTGYPLTLLLNSDVEVPPGWLDPLLDYMEAHEKCGALMPKILSWRDKGAFEYAGAAGGYIDRLGYPYCRGRIFGCVERDSGQYDGAPVPVAWASGAAMLVRTSLYRQVGGLDEKFFAHMEEIDLCLRIIRAGYEVMCVPASHVYHVGGASLAQGDPRKTYLNFRNNLLLLHKNMPRRAGRRKLFVRRLWDTLAWGMFLLKGELPHARAVVKAHRDFAKMRAYYTDFPDTDIFTTLPGTGKNVIVSHYLLGRKKYTDL